MSGNKVNGVDATDVYFASYSSHLKWDSSRIFLDIAVLFCIIGTNLHQSNYGIFLYGISNLYTKDFISFIFHIIQRNETNHTLYFLLFFLSSPFILLAPLFFFNFVVISSNAEFWLFHKGLRFTVLEKQFKLKLLF